MKTKHKILENPELGVVYYSTSEKIFVKLLDAVKHNDNSLSYRYTRSPRYFDCLNKTRISSGICLDTIQDKWTEIKNIKTFKNAMKEDNDYISLPHLIDTKFNGNKNKLLDLKLKIALQENE